MTAAVRELEDLMARGCDQVESALDRSPRDDLEGAGRQWLALARALIPRTMPGLRDAARLPVPLQPCLRDARPEHFLFEGDNLTGLIDYGAMGIETVAADLARLIGEWLGGNASHRERAICAYESVRILNDTELALATALESAADLLIGAHWLRWQFLEHHRFEDPGAVMSGLGRGLVRIGRLGDRTMPPRLII